jgi:hypothetical protein
MPIGYEGETQPLLEKVEPSSLLLNSVAALLNADLNDPIDNIVDSSIMGFVFMQVALLQPT